MVGLSGVKGLEITVVPPRVLTRLNGQIHGVNLHPWVVCLSCRHGGESRRLKGIGVHAFGRQDQPQSSKKGREEPGADEHGRFLGACAVGLVFNALSHQPRTANHGGTIQPLERVALRGEEGVDFRVMSGLTPPEKMVRLVVGEFHTTRHRFAPVDAVLIQARIAFQRGVLGHVFDHQCGVEVQGRTTGPHQQDGQCGAGTSHATQACGHLTQSCVRRPSAQKRIPLKEGVDAVRPHHDPTFQPHAKSAFA